MSNPIRRLRSARTALLAAALCLLGASPPVRAQEHTLHVSVIDGAGNPVAGLTEDDIVVRWDGEILETTGLEEVGWPVRLTVFVDNSRLAAPQVAHIREGLQVLLRELPAEMEIAFLTTARRTRWITRHTSDRAELERGIPLIAPDTGAPARFVDVLVEEAARIDEDDDREYYPVAVMVGAAAIDSSTSQRGRVDRMVERMVDNSVEVHALLFSGGVLGSRGGRDVIDPHTGDEFGLRVLGSRAGVIGEELVPITRGSFERITGGAAFVEKLTALGRDIAKKHRMVSSQYRITYRQPRKPSSQPAIDVATERQGLHMIPTLDGNVPARMPER